MNRHTMRAILALTATTSALTIAGAAHAAVPAPAPAGHAQAAVHPRDGLTDLPEDRGIVSTALDLLFGTSPDASPSAGGLVGLTGTHNPLYPA
ncbi:hypothetical protein ACFWVT_01970 [Streptomyces cyaneofuscatus]|uniref:hypothetical protein n=1 Tax=Streptomyces griseus group TaxID=629295 RepID=UPI003667BAD2